MDKLINFIKSHAYETGLALFSALFGSSIIAMRDLTLEAFDKYPLVIITLCALSFIIGLVIANCQDRRAAMIQKIVQEKQLEIDRRNREDTAKEAEMKRKAKEEENRKLEEIKKANQISDFRALSFRAKDILLGIYDRGHIELSTVAVSYLTDLGGYELMDYLDEEEISADVVQWRINDWACGLFEENPEVFDAVREDKYDSRIDLSFYSMD